MPITLRPVASDDFPAWRRLWSDYLAFEHVYDFAATAGCSRVHWLTQEGNATARLLYDRVADRPGFIQYRKKLTG